MLKSYLAFTSAVHHVLTRAYERLGAAIARKPLLTILLSVAAISLANLGLLKLRSVGDAIALWVPGASSYHEQRRAIDAAFGSFDQALALLLPRAPHRALSADVLLEAADLHETSRPPLHPTSPGRSRGRPRLRRCGQLWAGWIHRPKGLFAFIDLLPAKIAVL